jgi:predicted metalloprotease
MGGAGMGFPGRGLPGGGKLGLGGLLVLLVLSLVFGQNFFVGLDPGDIGSAPAPERMPMPGGAGRSASPGQDEMVEFVSFVLDDVQDTWTQVYRDAGQTYERAKLVLFTNAVRSGCGIGETAMGPFYCPVDQKVYIDLGFYRALRDRFGAPGDFAQAYVIAHEIGHHVQHQLGITDQVRATQQSRPGQANALSVRLELQADCLAGIWGHSTQERNLLEQGDVEEGLGAAAAIGDDRIQRQTAGRTNPETWTHGSSRQRVAWFQRGLKSGRIQDCDTFKIALPGVDDQRGR